MGSSSNRIALLRSVTGAHKDPTLRQAMQLSNHSAEQPVAQTSTPDVMSAQQDAGHDQPEPNATEIRAATQQDAGHDRPEQDATQIRAATLLLRMRLHLVLLSSLNNESCRCLVAVLQSLSYSA